MSNVITHFFKPAPTHQHPVAPGHVRMDAQRDVLEGHVFKAQSAVWFAANDHRHTTIIISEEPHLKDRLLRGEGPGQGAILGMEVGRTWWGQRTGTLRGKRHV